jgi:hypothetical protein
MFIFEWNLRQCRQAKWRSQASDSKNAIIVLVLVVVVVVTEWGEMRSGEMETKEVEGCCTFPSLLLTHPNHMALRLSHGL